MPEQSLSEIFGIINVDPAETIITKNNSENCGAEIGDIKAVVINEGKESMKNIEFIRECASLIISWCAASRRPLPWRLSPTPYHIWISEVMLQQTRIEAVIPYYERFLEELPDVQALADTEEDKLLKLWEGLGYYSRARNLQKAAKIITQNFEGKIPKDPEQLRSLPGIGEYTAGAIASIAYGLPEPAVDGNVLRVAARLMTMADDVKLPKTRRTVTELLRAVYPAGDQAGLLTEGLMELGETICLPNTDPNCDHCPLAALCQSHLRGTTGLYPVRGKIRERRKDRRTVLLLCANGKYAIRKREGEGLLAGMWEFPNVTGHLTAEEVESVLTDFGAEPVRIEECGRTKHVFSHVEWHLKGYKAKLESETEGFVWKTPEEMLSDVPIPTAFQYYIKKL